MFGNTLSYYFGAINNNDNNVCNIFIIIAKISHILGNESTLYLPFKECNDLFLLLFDFILVLQ